MSLYGLIIGISIAIGIELFSKQNKIICRDRISFFSIGLILSALIGARLFHVVERYQFYLHKPFLEIFNTRNGGLAIYGGIIGSLFFIWIYSIRNKLSILKITDSIAPILPLCQSIGRWGNFANQEIFGIPTYSNFGQFIIPENRPQQFTNYSYFHPVWLYESILCLILFVIIKKHPKKPTAVYLIGYGTVRFLLEFLRYDSIKIGPLSHHQIISILAILIGIFIAINYSDNEKYR